jgi:hypothetical protein
MCGGVGTKDSFEWGLGIASNNQAEALDLYQELKIIDIR